MHNPVRLNFTMVCGKPSIRFHSVTDGQLKQWLSATDDVQASSIVCVRMINAHRRGLHSFHLFQ